ncbi:MAG: hypothetical protein ACREGG_04550, partial [Candidatus Saccharimonadales bacterium]
MAVGKIISTTTHTRTSGQLIDGFVKAPPKSTQFHKRTQKAQTLMRAGLKRPVTKQRPTLSGSTHHSKIETQLRAKTVLKNSRVNHFGIPRGASRIATPFRATKRAVSGEVINNGTPQAAQASAAPLPSMVASASHQKLERLLDEALATADAHKQALKHHAARHFWQRRWFSGPKRWGLLGIILLVLVIGAVFAWRSVPQLSIKLAGMRAHLSAVVPTYKPDGYKLASPANTDAGAVSIKYKSATAPDQTYSIVEAQSNMTSNLVAQNVVPKGASVQTSQVDGNTVYIYGSSNDAAWVNNGLLYKIKNS